MTKFDNISFDYTDALQLSSNIDNSTWENENRCASIAEIIINNKKVLLYSLHLASNACKPSKYRFEQLNNLTNYIESKSPECVIGGGDFNVYKNSPCLQPITEKQDLLIKGDLGATCSLAEEETLSWPIDRVYGSGFKSIFSEKLAFPKLSDHCMVLTDLVMSDY